ncbi:helix-turn-helix transcriptional regulator [Luteolibacter algae]|uniref:Helix-turn-helix transcriptional regulator n=1 Tax=Luteolibacter algae TaxID=454151 RepID=A0ABW5D7F8_9BACT
MADVHKDLKVVQRDGMVIYIPTNGQGVPLSKLAFQCGYRIDAMCSLLEVSPRHFRRIFTEALGMSPKKWLKSERMVFARNLLRGGLSIKEVSDRLGFSSQKDFYLDFREYYSIAPSDFQLQETERVMEKLGWAN